MHLSVFILVSLAASALALKGETSTSTAKAPGSIRRLQPGPPKDKEGPGSKQPPPPKEDAAPKGDKEMKDKKAKEDKKAKDNKKCKKAKKDVKKFRVLVDKAGGAPDPKEKMPKAPKDPSTGDEADPAGTEPPAMAPVIQPDAADVVEPDAAGVVEGDADSPYCLQSTLSAAQCEAIRKGELPVSANTARGLLTLELSYDTDQKDALDTVEDILRTKTPTTFVGCPETFRFLEEEEGGDEVMDTEEDPYVTGLGFGEFTISGEGTYQFSSAVVNVHC